MIIRTFGAQSTDIDDGSDNDSGNTSGGGSSELPVNPGGAATSGPGATQGSGAVPRGGNPDQPPGTLSQVAINLLTKEFKLFYSRMIGTPAHFEILDAIFSVLGQGNSTIGAATNEIHKKILALPETTASAMKVVQDAKTKILREPVDSSDQPYVTFTIESLRQGVTRSEIAATLEAEYVKRLPPGTKVDASGFPVYESGSGSGPLGLPSWLLPAVGGAILLGAILLRR